MKHKNFDRLNIFSGNLFQVTEKKLIKIFIGYIILAMPLVIGCQQVNDNAESSAKKDYATFNINAQESKISIVYIDSLIKQNKKSEGANIYSQAAAINDNNLFEKTQTGAFISRFLIEDTGESNVEKIRMASVKILDIIGNDPLCRTRCTGEFKKEFKNNKSELQQTLIEMAIKAIANEQNNNDYLVFYHAFPNKFRLYQDVLRNIKSYEYLRRLDNTYPFRDFPFTESKLSLESFLKDWWQHYLDFVKEKKVSPFPLEGQESPGKGIGLTFYPDSIPYAQKRIFSANDKLFGNTLSLISNSIYFFLNSTSAQELDVVDILIKDALYKYVIDINGKIDEEKMDKVINDLKSVYDQYMRSTGGQIAQIFIKKPVAKEVAYWSWVGGEPIWVSNTTKHIVYSIDSEGKMKTMPPLVFWPTADEQHIDYHLPDISQMITSIIANSSSILSFFPYLSKTKLSSAKKIISSDEDEVIRQFVAQDTRQARVLPLPKVFTDENMTSTRIFTQHEISQDKLTAYDEALYQIIRAVFDDFLANASSGKDFKEGNYPLKSAFGERK